MFMAVLSRYVGLKNGKNIAEFKLFKGFRLAGILPVFIYLVFANSSACAIEPNFSAEHTFELRKDEWGVIRLTELATQKVEEFSFRWSLYDWTNLTIQSFYRLYPRQHILSLRTGQRSLSQKLLPPTKYPPNDEASLLISFNKFDNGTASFHAGILDAGGRISAEFIDPKR